MAGRGPAPKSAAQRRRRNKTVPVTVLVADGKVRGPELPESLDWPDATLKWYEGPVRRSPTKWLGKLSRGTSGTATLYLEPRQRKGRTPRALLGTLAGPPCPPCQLFRAASTATGRGGNYLPPAIGLTINPN
jgi:hypothetical protein